MTLIKETGATPPPPHTWTVPLVEDMLCHGRTGLTKAVVMGPGRAILFYGRWSLGEGPSLGKARDAHLHSQEQVHRLVSQSILPLTL